MGMVKYWDLFFGKKMAEGVSKIPFLCENYVYDSLKIDEVESAILKSTKEHSYNSVYLLNIMRYLSLILITISALERLEATANITDSTKITRRSLRQILVVRVEDILSCFVKSVGIA